ncbi:MAG: TIGR03013 family PEP-CTERM/XrtA system glycosyltransferase [Alphaproteobacteria bacterium]|nr:TIGR03013 family PEP-CTERM/XrtA system glycosyltransferase [Alphaproteobacteria bacterium]
MVRIFRHYVSPIKLALASIDFVLLLLCAVGAELFRYFLSDLPLVLSVGWAAWAAKVLFAGVCLPALLGVGVYQSESLADYRVFWVRLLVGLAATAVVSSALLYLFPMLPFWRSILALAIIFSGLAILFVRSLFMIFGSPQILGRRVLLLGAGETAENLLKYASDARESGLNIVRTVALSDDNANISNAVKLEDIGSLDQYVFSNHIEMIIVTTDDHKQKLPLEALISCKLAGVEVKDKLAFFEQMRGYVDVSSVKAEWIVFSDGFRGGSQIERAAKRLLDLLVSLTFVVATSPIMVVAGLLVKLTSRGPVFYLQERVGLDGQEFKLFKFRSMKIDAESSGAPQWAQEKDPRVTVIGGFLRRTRIDELPQILNVLRGDMSFVGPRPERPFFVKQLGAEIPFYNERHCVKPGITGWAQIRYPYGASVEDARRKLEYDLYYIKNYSLFLDLLIIIQTVRVILFPSGVR